MRIINILLICLSFFGMILAFKFTKEKEDKIEKISFSDIIINSYKGK